MIQSFSELGLPDHVLATLATAGFTTPTPIQAQAIEPQMAGRDILGIAQTGSGKTAAFGLPILAGISKLGGRPAPMTTRALILAPTRELAVQIDEVLRMLGAGMKLTTLLVLGGVSRHSQVQKAARGVDIVIATPGRLKDLVDDRKLRLDQTRWLVLDEADRMLDMGFIKPVREIAAAIGPRRQTALFSATMAPEVAELTRSLLKDPVRVEAAPPATTAVTIEQKVIMAGTKQKREVLNELLADPALGRVILFSRTKHGADRVAKNLAIDGHEAAAIHGNKSQNARQAALKGFAAGRVRILVATDIAARGIDVPGITHVINYELPDDAENYVHRIGRTGRNGASGIAITLCCGTEYSKLRDVEKLIRQKLPLSGDLALANGNAGQPEPARAAKPAHRGRGDRGPAAARPGQRSGAPRKSSSASGDARGPAEIARATQKPAKRAWTPDRREGGDAPRARTAGSRRSVNA
ncbi:ATP-dependent RNA helicase RhlE [Devosia enhydra]|uniref:ATP-dependent RNA helicase RhlE n=1 Tax=Devosia enhydra TaxID=665118 RepID=A0A1K2HW76_9HYPH|nr:ATP-dependent RNA helicase RhlE [Devosia enhydra]